MKLKQFLIGWVRGNWRQAAWSKAPRQGKQGFEGNDASQPKRGRLAPCAVPCCPE